MRWWKAFVIWHPVNLGGLTLTQQRDLPSSKEQLKLAASSTMRGPRPGPPCIPAAVHQFRNDPGYGCDWTISTKPAPLLLAGGRFEWQLLPISAGRWPRVGSEALGKCDPLVLLYSAQAQVQRLLASAMELAENNKAVAAAWGDWFVNLGSTQAGILVASRLPVCLVSHLYFSWDVVISQHFLLCCLDNTTN